MLVLMLFLADFQASVVFDVPLEREGEFVTHFLNTASTRHGFVLLDVRRNLWLVAFDGSAVTLVAQKGQHPSGMGDWSRGIHGTESDGFVVLTAGGMVGTSFAADGTYLGVAKPGRECFFMKDSLLIDCKPTIPPIFGPEARVFLAGKEQRYAVQEEPEKEKISLEDMRACPLGDKVLLFNRAGNLTLYTLVVSQGDGSLLARDASPLFDRRMKASHENLPAVAPGQFANLRFLGGAHACPDLGWVLTETSRDEEYRVIRVLDPSRYQWQAARVRYPAKFHALTDFRHLKGDQWACLAREKMVVLTIPGLYQAFQQATLPPRQLY